MNETLRNMMITLGLFALTTVFAAMAKTIGGATNIVVVLYILMVLLVSRMTKGFIWGILASFAGVLAANYIFTMPFFEFNFKLDGYPITFIVMLTTSLITSTLTYKYKIEKEKSEAYAAQLKQSYEEQRQIEVNIEKEKMKNNLLRTISHDLRTPLTGISGAASTILENKECISEDSEKKLLSGIVDESKWLIRLVENLLSVTHISESNMKVIKSDEIAEEVIADAISHFQATNSLAEINVRVPDEILIVPMDSTLIELTILNLLDNAAKYSSSDPVIHIELYRKNDRAYFKVQDNGNGIIENDLPYIFEYGMTSSTSSDSRRGFGIGLPTCKGIVEAHSGEISVTSKPGEGTAFTFYLPMKTNESA